MYRDGRAGRDFEPLVTDLFLIKNTERERLKIMKNKKALSLLLAASMLAASANVTTTALH